MFTNKMKDKEIKELKEKIIEFIKDRINSLSKNLQIKISSVSDVLLDFGVFHFESRVDEKINMTGTYGSIKSSARLIGNNVSELLAMILTSGEKLNEDTIVLSKASLSLSISVNQINNLSQKVSHLSTKLVQAASLADYSKQTKNYICNVDLVFKTAKLKNDHIRFKETNFSKLGRNKTWSVVSHHDCALGKWIDQSENDEEKCLFETTLKLYDSRIKL